jgi:origin recognition complex subunit 4
MLYESFKRQLKLSSAAPIQLNGTSIGMVKVSREIMMSVSWPSFYIFETP